MRTRVAAVIAWMVAIPVAAVILAVAVSHGGPATNAQSGSLAKRASLPMVACDSCGPTPTPTPTPRPAVKWYTSSHPTARYYYCELDDGWRNLSPTYLREYPSEEALLAEWAGRRVKHPDSKC